MAKKPKAILIDPDNIRDIEALPKDAFPRGITSMQSKVNYLLMLGIKQKSMEVSPMKVEITEIDGKKYYLTTESSACSYGQPVLESQDGPLGPGDMLMIDGQVVPARKIVADWLQGDLPPAARKLGEKFLQFPPF